VACILRRTLAGWLGKVLLNFQQRGVGGQTLWQPRLAPAPASPTTRLQVRIGMRMKIARGSFAPKVALRDVMNRTFNVVLCAATEGSLSG